MIEKKYSIPESHTVLKKRDRERRNSITRGLIIVILALAVIWFLFGFLGSFFETSQKHTVNYETPKSNQMITDWEKNSKTIPVTPHESVTSSPSYKQNFSDQKNLFEMQKEDMQINEHMKPNTNPTPEIIQSVN
ncbi:hypothetical protein [Bartonella sp. F02]|uniref:hypothetical protein n=1 Tax=Bartonella sp. F02 TaxID=2967262 RepID=UPI0022A8EA94|nr:hypothetical protein [Bartonella sp. F02]MCZ2328169.1 hypothetical protein [Bartonella sp. F02]